MVVVVGGIDYHLTGSLFCVHFFVLCSILRSKYRQFSKVQGGGVGEVQHFPRLWGVQLFPGPIVNS